MQQKQVLNNYYSINNQNTCGCECDLFTELNKFRRNIEEGRCGLHHYPYTTNKNRIILYKSIFLGLCGLFLCLANYLYFSHLSWTFSFIFKDHMPIKEIFALMCCVFSSISAGIGLMMSPEKELTLETILKAKGQLRKIYKRRLRAVSCVNNSNPMGTSHEKTIIIHAYEDATEKLENIKNETLLTLKRIKISKLLNESQKEHLYNQLILELQFKLEQLTNAYLRNDFAAAE